MSENILLGFKLEILFVKLYNFFKIAHENGINK